MLELLLAAPNPTAGADLSWLGSAVVAAIAAAVVAGLFATIQAVGNKKLRSPADRLAEVEFYVKLAQTQVTEAREDKKALEATLGTIRSYVETLEQNGRLDAGEIRDRDTQLKQLRKEIDALERRAGRKEALAKALQRTIDAVAEKVLQGAPITLADLEPIGYRPESFLDTGELELAG